MATKIFTSDLRVGMFVADLDRPWVDTPFLLQGFLIDDEEQVAALRAHCEFVMVDRARSVGDEYEAPAAARIGSSTIPPAGSTAARPPPRPRRGAPPPRRRARGARPPHRRRRSRPRPRRGDRRRRKRA